MEPTWPVTKLSATHRAILESSAISTTVAEERGYRSVSKKVELRDLGFTQTQSVVPALLLPIHDVFGKLSSYQIRADEPRIRDGKPAKYELASGSRMVLDVPLRVQGSLANPRIPLLITEGVRKADSAASAGLSCVALLGVWNWRGTNEWGGKAALPDWDSIALNDREVFIAFDSDAMTKREVHDALGRLRKYLKQRDADVRVIYLPPTEDGRKQGLDDFLASGATTEALFALASQDFRTFPGPIADTTYRSDEHGMYRGDTRIANFSATITGDILELDGAGQSQHVFELTAAVGDRSLVITVPATEYETMRWVPEKLGASAVILAGVGTKDHVRAAIQLGSGSIPQRQVHAHTGWTQLEIGWAYMHAGGAIGPVGPVDNVQVSFSGVMQHYRFPQISDADDLRKAVESSLQLLSVAPAEVIFPLFAATYRSVMGPCDSGIFIVGNSGTGKSELASLLQRHFGPRMDRNNLPGNWSSTANANEATAFSLKDALFVIDDFAPVGSTADVNRLHANADRIFRAQGNGSGRARMRRDTSLLKPNPPRGLILATGEDVPKGQSLQARLLILALSDSIGRGIDWHLLADCQAAATRGDYAKAMGAFIGWLAADYEAKLKEFESHVELYRTEVLSGDLHRRTPELIANLGAAMAMFTSFAVSSKAISTSQAADLRSKAWAALISASESQSEYQNGNKPAERYLSLIRSALMTNVAYLEPLDSMAMQDQWQHTSGGEMIGWYDAQYAYFEPEASFGVASKLAQKQGEPITVSKSVIQKRLREAKLIVVDSREGHTLARKTVNGKRMSVLQMELHHIFDIADQAAHTIPKSSSLDYGILNFKEKRPRIA